MNHVNNTVAGTVVLFNPVNEVFDEISSYVNQLGRLYIIDNSIHYNNSLIEKLSKFDKVVYVDNKGNQGIAAALNRGAQLALQDGFRFLLTMDQDTSLSGTFVSNLMKGVIENDASQIGIIAPRYSPRSSKQVDRFQRVLFTMTSGNILNLSVYEKVGPFLEELFIDHVDHEYCLRLNKLGFKVIQDNMEEIIHRPGTLRTVSARLSFSAHSPTRLYYFTRNGFYISKMYENDFPVFKRTFLKLLLKEIAKIPFEDSKMLRLRMIVKAFEDCKRKRFGAIGAINR